MDAAAENKLLVDMNDHDRFLRPTTTVAGTQPSTAPAATQATLDPQLQRHDRYAGGLVVLQGDKSEAASSGAAQLPR